MRSEKDVEAYLWRLNRRFRAIDIQPGTFLVETGRGTPPVAIRVEPPLVVIRVHMGDIDSRAASVPLLHRLLELNARQLVHVAYGIDDDRIVLSSALELENLDFNEVQAVLDEIDMVLAQQLAELAGLASAGPQSTSDAPKRATDTPNSAANSSSGATDTPKNKVR